jgi:hypothetical protein
LQQNVRMRESGRGSAERYCSREAYRGTPENIRIWSRPREQRQPGLIAEPGGVRGYWVAMMRGPGPRATLEVTYASGRAVSATSGCRRSRVDYRSSGASKTLRSREGLSVAGSVPLGRELGRTAAAWHEGDGSVGRTTSVHELSALRWLTGWLTRRLAWRLIRWLAWWLCASLRFGLGGIIPGHAEREHAGYKYQKHQSYKDRLRNRTAVPHRIAPPLC